MRKVLLTGFEPFDGQAINPSEELARAAGVPALARHGQTLEQAGFTPTRLEMFDRLNQQRGVVSSAPRRRVPLSVMMRSPASSVWFRVAMLPVSAPPSGVVPSQLTRTSESSSFGRSRK